MAAKGKVSANLQARIKKMMQSDEDVGKVAKASPVLIAKALDIFLQSMVEGATQIAERRGARMLTASHIKAHIEGEELFDFLKDAVAQVPALPPEGTEPAKGKAKRQRAKNGDGEAGPAKVRGRSVRGGRGGRGHKGSTAGDDEGNAAATEGAAAAECDTDEQPVAAATGAAAVVAAIGGVAAEEQAAGDFGSGGVGTDASQQQQQQQQHQEQPDKQQVAAAGDEVPSVKATTSQQEQGGTDTANAAAAAGTATAMAPIVSMRRFLAAATVPGAEAEEEDYDA